MVRSQKVTGLMEYRSWCFQWSWVQFFQTEDAVAFREHFTWGPGTAVQAEKTRRTRPGGASYTVETVKP